MFRANNVGRGRWCPTRILDSGFGRDSSGGHGEISTGQTAGVMWRDLALSTRVGCTGIHGGRGQSGREVERMRLIEGRAIMLLEDGRSSSDAAQLAIAHSCAHARTLAVSEPLVLTCQGGAGC